MKTYLVENNQLTLVENKEILDIKELSKKQKPNYYLISKVKNVIRYHNCFVFTDYELFKMSDSQLYSILEKVKSYDRSLHIERNKGYENYNPTDTGYNF